MVCIPTKYGSVQGRAYKNGIEIYEYKGSDLQIDLTELEKMIEKPIVSIAKKAFLSCKSIRVIRLGTAVTEIGDWAFSYCTSLEEIQFLSREVRLGKELFKDCNSLKRMIIPDDDTEELLAAAVVKLKVPHLFHLQKKEAEWYEQYDRNLLTFIDMDDGEALVGNMVGGEEEYGTQEPELQLFMHEKRMEKVRLAFLRLIHSKHLTEQVEQRLKSYLIGHTIGELHSEAWDVLMENRTDISYSQAFLETGCFHHNNYQQALDALKDTDSEMKALFIKYKNNVLGYDDFFGLLTDL